MIERSIEKSIRKACFKGKVILLIGARQVGKTTLLKEVLQSIDAKSLWLNADEADILHDLTIADTSSKLLSLFENHTLVIIDEAQQIPDIGKKLKLLFDTHPEIQVIATGSSAFDMQDQTSEPLTGRKKTFYLYPVSYSEWAQDISRREARRLLENRLIYGSYPEVIVHPGEEREILIELSQSYLYKDILQLDNLRKPAHIDKLLRALAFQVGSEVSYNELANTIGNIDTATIEKYLDILEKTYVIFKLPAYHRNQRNEIKKGKKYYFYDNGIRNVLINNFTSMDMRFDKGALWENFLIAERMKRNAYTGIYANTFFWRTKDKAEIDYIEEREGKLFAYEFKWKSSHARFPRSFLNSYPNNETQLVNMENFETFIME